MSDARVLSEAIHDLSETRARILRHHMAATATPVRARLKELAEQLAVEKADLESMLSDRDRNRN